MELLNIFNSTDKRYQRFYEKTGIRITDEPIKETQPELADTIEGMFHLAQKNPNKALPELEKLVLKYPDQPSIKNYLYICYETTGQHEKADKILDLTIRKHPDYIFGISGKIMSTMDKKEVENFGHLLGNPRDIRTFKPHAAVYHISEFAAYETAAGVYEAMTGDEKSAMRRLENLIELKVEKPKLKEFARRIGLARLTNGIGRFQEASEKRIVVESFPKIKLEPTDEPPQLEHPELAIFYQKSIAKLSKGEIEKIINLPHHSLIRDLERILEDSIRRYDFFREMDYEDNTHEFIIHALYFLGALRAEGTLQKVLNLLRMGEDFSDYWFADVSNEYFHPTLYTLGENQLGLLKDFVLEPNLFYLDRLLACHVPAQVALHHPERRAEVVKWYEEVFNHLLENENDKGLIDSDFIAFTVAEVLDFRGKELLPLIEKLYAKGWIQDTIQGNLEDMKKEIEKPDDPSEIDPQPMDIHEYYSKAYNKRKADMPEWRKKELNEFLPENDSEAEKLVMNTSMETLMKGFTGRYLPLGFEDEEEVEYYDDYDEIDHRYEPVEQVKRIAPKVGRNDPCPCGSGKKYKKCCMKK